MPGIGDSVPSATAAAALGAVQSHAKAAASAVATRQYLLQPVGGSAAYERRGRTEGAPGEGEASQSVALRLDTLAGRLSHEQLGHFQRMGAALSAAMRRAPHAHLRPRSAVAAAPAEWWKYAVAATAEHAHAASAGRLRWDRVVLVARSRRRYVALYKAHIVASAKKAKKGVLQPPRCEVPELVELENALAPEAALLFRVLAHREVSLEAPAAKPAASPLAARGTPGEVAPSPKPASRLARLFGYGPTAAAEPPSPSSSTPPSRSASGSSAALDAAGNASVMSMDDWAQLTEVFELTESKIEAAKAIVPLHPDAMTFKATLAVDVGSVQLVSDDPAAPPLLYSSLSGVTALVRRFSGQRMCATLGIVLLAADAAGVKLLRTEATGTAGDDASVPAFSLEYEKAPLDGHADTVISLASAPAHITADLVAVRTLVKFFARPPGLDTAVLAQTVTETVSDAAAAAAVKAGDGLKSLQGRALKVDLRLAVAAPKILLPTANGAGLLLDLGFLQLESVPMSADTPRGTECFKLDLNDVSATFVAHDWDWSRLGQEGSALPQDRLQTLLSPTGLQATLLRCAVPGPGRPALTLSLDVGAMGLELSPSSVSRFWRVIMALSPLWTSEGAPWAHSQHEGPLWVLTRNGTSPGRLVWARRWGVLAGEFLYLLESRDTPANARVAFVSLRHGMEVAPLPSRAAAGQSGVLAVLPHGVVPARATSHSRTTLLRGDDDASSATWLAQLRGVRKRRHLAAARRKAVSTMAAPAALAAQLDGLEHLIEDDEDLFADASAAEVLEDAPDGDQDADAQDRFSDAASEVASDSDTSSESTVEGATSATDKAALETFVLIARLDELTLSLAGVPHRTFGGGAAAERPIIVLRMRGAAARYGQRMHDLSVAVRLQSLVVVDCVAAEQAPGAGEVYVLTSEATAVADTFPHYLRREMTGATGLMDAMLDSANAHATGEDGTALVRFSYQTRTENSPDYAGSACDITVRLAAVALAVRRPSLAAIVALYYDFYAPPSDAPAQTSHAAPAESSSTGNEAATAAVAAKTAALVSWAAGEGPEEKVAPPALGGMPRIVMRIDVAMESALMQLLLEGAHRLAARCMRATCSNASSHADGVELLAMSVENLSAVLLLRQATLELDTSLGNVRMRDGRCAVGHAYRWILDLQQNQTQIADSLQVAPGTPAGAQTAGSLIALKYATHVKGCVTAV